MGGIHKFEESRSALLLFLFALEIKVRSRKARLRKSTHMEIQYWYVNIIQQLPVVFYGVATRKEDDDLFLQILLQEGK